MQQLTKFPLVYILILNWNNWPDTVECIDSCLNLTYPNKHLLIIDNGSTDDSEKTLRERYPGITFIQTGRNLGFSGGNNCGIEAAIAAGAEYIWLLNNDTVVAPDALDALVSALDADAHGGMAASMIYYHGSDRIWSAGGSWRPGLLKLRQRGAYSTDSSLYCRNEYVGSASACSLLVRSETVQRIGALDENYFLYWEDTDWCARALSAGKKILFVPGSKVWHKVSASADQHSKLQYYYYTRNGLLFFQRHDPVCFPLFLMYTLADVFIALIRARTEMIAGFLQGILDYSRRRFGHRDFEYKAKHD